MPTLFAKRIAFFVVSACLAMPALAEVQVVRSSGEVELQYAGHFDDDKVVEVAVESEGFSLTARLRLDIFFDKHIINANADVENNRDEAVFYRYYIAFFDAEGGLIGCAGQGSFGDDGMDAGDNTQLGSCLIEIDPEIADSIASYQMLVYVSDRPIGLPAEEE